MIAPAREASNRAFDHVAWNLSLAASTRAGVVLAFDAEGASAELLSEEIATARLRAEASAATVVAVVLTCGAPEEAGEGSEAFEDETEEAPETEEKAEAPAEETEEAAPAEEEAETPEEAVPTEEAPEAPAEETAAPASDETDAPEAE